MASIYDYVASEVSPETANRFTDSIVDYCLGFSNFPNRGKLREDLRPGLRIVGFRRGGAIAVKVHNDVVFIIGIF